MDEHQPQASRDAERARFRSLNVRRIAKRFKSRTAFARGSGVGTAAALPWLAESPNPVIPSEAQARKVEQRFGFPVGSLDTEDGPPLDNWTPPPAPPAPPSRRSPTQESPDLFAELSPLQRATIDVMLEGFRDGTITKKDCVEILSKLTPEE